MTQKGRIKRGKGLFVGNAGEYYVMAELLKQDIVAALAPRNTPSFDILATKDRRTVTIRVKTKSQHIPIWQYSVRKENPIFRDLSEKGDFTVLVDLAIETKNMKFYVLPTKQVNTWLKRDFEVWLKTPGKRGRPHSPENPKRNLDQKKYSQELSKHLNRWENLWS